MNRIVSNTYIRGVILVVFYILGTVTASADKIKVIPTDPSVCTEIMPNGLSCYVVKTSAQKGKADFALVQNVGFQTDSDLDKKGVVDISRAALSGQKRLLAPSVQDFFISHGAAAGKDGFVKVDQDATTYHFRDMDVSSSVVVDSTLLVLMSMVDNASEIEDIRLRKYYSPADQAIIVSGDVDAAAVMGKLRTLSYMVMRSEPVSRDEYAWHSVPGINVQVQPSTSTSLSSIRIQWRIPRTPKAQMNTVQPLVVDMYMNELAILAKKRIISSLRGASIPYSSVECAYLLPQTHLEDNIFSVDVTLAPEDVSKAVSICAGALSSLEAGRVSVSDQESAEYAYYDKRLSSVRTLSNAAYVDKCRSAFLYNESLASAEAENQFLMTRHIADTTELKIFKSIVSATLTPDANMSLLCSLPQGNESADDLAAIFAHGWQNAPEEPVQEVGGAGMTISFSDTKLKVKSSKKEYLSGGTMLTLSNGMRVVFKHADTKDVIHWSLALNGGFGNISDLKEGEAGYVSEFLDMCRIAGMDAASFKESIRRKGMTMDINVEHATTSLRGRIPDDGLEDLLGYLLIMMDTFVPDQEAIEYRLKCEPLMLKHRTGGLKERIAVVDSVMCPGYRYTTRKGGFDMDFIRKAEAFFKDLFTRVDDGVLVLVGDIDEKVLKDALIKRAGSFSTSGRKASRPVVSYQPISGTVKMERRGRAAGVDMVLSAPMSLTADNRYIAEITAMCLAEAVSRLVQDGGLHVRVTHRSSFYPQERVSMMLSLREAPQDGFSSETFHKDPSEALTAVRNLLKNIESAELTSSQLDACKKYLKQKIKQDQQSPEYWLDAISMRYVSGRDFHSGFEAKVDAVTVDAVRGLLKQLSNGARVEYIINKR